MTPDAVGLYCASPGCGKRQPFEVVPGSSGRFRCSRCRAWHRFAVSSRVEIVVALEDAAVRTERRVIVEGVV